MVCIVWSYLHYFTMRKFKRILFRLLKLVLAVSCAGFLVPFFIFWRGEYVHILKSRLAQGEICPDKILLNMATGSNVNKWAFRNISFKQHGWQAVDNGNIFYLFSSYYMIDRDSRYVLLIGALDKRTYDDLQCTVMDNTKVKYVPARYMAMWDDQLLCVRTNPYYTVLWNDHILCRYSPAFFMCELPKSFRPTAVTLSKTFCKIPTQMFKITYPSQRKKRFTLCVAPLYGPYDNVYEMIHMMELNRILGADYFTFYNFNISSRVQKVLNYYINLGLAEIIDWDMPINLSKIHYYGQMAALNDCLYRNRYKSQYIVVQDLDEFIIPHKVRTWTEMMLDLPHGLNSYSFQSIQFSTNLADTESEFNGKNAALKYKLTSLLKQRHGPVYDRTTRTKYIVDASRVAELGIHNTWRLQSGSTGNEYHVPPEDALMFHYRRWFNEKEKFVGKQNSQMMVYNNELIGNVEKVYKELKIS